jgi:cytochrome c oxidase assembly factor 6
MSWLPSWLTGNSNPSLPSSSHQPPRSADGGYVAPDRTSREACYLARDTFFTCLDEHSILDANKEDEKSRKLCPQEVMAYEKDCAKSWIKYFKEKRVVDYKRDMTLEQIAREDSVAAAKAKAKKGMFS